MLINMFLLLLKNKPLTAIQIKNNFLKRKITDIFLKTNIDMVRQKIYHVLLKENISVSLRYVQKLM